ncbi:MAG: universal stress protein [Acidobacteriota bacterium]|nr:universal stress protein [Acidobacteriota bacterium]
MATMMAIPRSVQLKHILYLTDFSRAAESALPFAIGIARAHGSTLHALHVLLAPIQNYPEPVKAGRKFAEGEMKRVEAKLSGVIHETKIAPAINLWQVIDEAIRGHTIDLIVVGTRGRTGPERLCLGSAAEEIFRRSPVPVMTVGPDVKRAEREGQLDRILFATDFTPHSVAALPYAIALSAENRTRLLLVHVLPKRRESGNGRGERREMSVAESFHELHEMVPSDLPLSQSADFAVEFGRPADAIVAAAGRRKASLIVLGIRNAEGHLEAATHLEGGIAHKIVIHAPCPVVTVRG